MSESPFQTPDAAAAPPPASVLNPSGQAAMLLVCDHASRVLPAAYGTLGLGEADLRRHIAWDIGAAEVTTHLAALLDAPAVLAGYSRLLVDCNRAMDDPTLICRVSDGTLVPGNRTVDQAETARRVERFHTPYHLAVAAELDRAAGRLAAPALVAIHSFTPVMKGFERPWHVGILWGGDPRLALPLLALLQAESGLVVGDNEPYSGRLNFGYTMVRHAAPAGLPHVLIEIRQDLVDTHHGAETWAVRLAAALRRVFAAAGPFHREHF